MAILGILSIIQMIILPGLIISKLIRFNYGGVPRIVAIFGISLFANYLLVALLTFCHMLLQTTLLVIIILEIAVCFWLFRKTILDSFEALSSRYEHRLGSINYSTATNPGSSSFQRIVNQFVFFVLLIFAFSDIVWVFQRFTNNLTTVFQTWDAVVSWNRWAVEWANGAFPTATSYYPQLIPANWSISYVLMNGIELQSFPKAIMPLFSLLILLMLFDLGIKTKSFGFFIGVIFTRLVIKKFTGEFIADGYVDLPMAFFCFASIYLLLCARFNADKNNSNLGVVITSVILAAGAALTKQAGVFIFILLPVLGYVILYKQFPDIFNAQKRKNLLFAYLLGLLIVASWYFVKWVQIHGGLDSSNVTYVTKDIYDGAGYLKRALDAFILLGKYKYFLLALIPAVLLVKKPYKWLVIIIAIPFSIIWIFFFSYEVRNLALIFPIWGLTIGLFVQELFEYIWRFFSFIKIQKISAITLMILLVLGLGFIGIKYPLQYLIHNQEEQQWLLFNPELNVKIREMVEETGPSIKILTNYPVDYLPGLNGTQVSFWYDNLPDYVASVALPDIDYLLVPNNAIPEINAEIQKGLDNGLLQSLFTVEGAYSYRMFKVLH